MQGHCLWLLGDGGSVKFLKSIDLNGFFLTQTLHSSTPREGVSATYGMQRTYYSLMKDKSQSVEQQKATENGKGGSVAVSFRVNTPHGTDASDDSFSSLGVVGNISELGSWNLGNLIRLKRLEGSDSVWVSDTILLPAALPFRYRVVANGNRSHPNKRPLLWDVFSRHVYTIPDDGVVQCTFTLSGKDVVDSGWVHGSGAGALQLRVESPPGSTEPLVKLYPEYNQEHRVRLYEARAKDASVPGGKEFACEVYSHVSLGDQETKDSVMYIMNGQCMEDLEFGIDILDSSGDVFARGFVPVESIIDLEGEFAVSLLSLRDFKLAGIFKATYLVVKELSHPKNTLCSIQRTPWTSGKQVTLDIGHRGSGASKVQGHSVRENTLLSFQKAALNHSDFIEFDVHLTSDNEVVVHHDFEVTLGLGKTQIKVALPLIRSDQVRSKDFAERMSNPSEHHKGEAIKVEKNKREASLKRTMTSGEDMYRNIFYKPMHSMSPASPSDLSHELNQMRVFLSDDSFASLRQAFRMTPTWLGFNIELKYPTDEEIVAMGTRFYSRNFFVDAVLSTVLEEYGRRKVIFSTFDPACAELLRLKQCKFNVFFLTCGGTKVFKDPRMNSVEAALQFAQANKLHGVVAEISSIVDRLDTVVPMFHQHGLYLFTYGDMNNNIQTYSKQKDAGIDAIIMDDVARIGKQTNKTASMLSNSMRSPSSLVELCSDPSVSELQLMDLDRMASQINISALSPIGSPDEFFT